MSQPLEATEPAGEGQASGLFPLAYYVGFLEFLAAHPNIDVVTYADLPFEDDWDEQHNYPQERKRWAKLNAGSDRVQVLLQHDVDRSPGQTMEVLRHQERLGVPSNVMIFRRRINRKLLRKEGRLEFTPYELDLELLQRLEREERFVIGYHSNAMEQGAWDFEAAARVFVDDVRALRERFTIDVFCPHGGVTGPDALNNFSLEIPEELQGDLRWVANRRSVRFDGYFSDGGISSPNRDLATLDLRDRVRAFKPGRRYRILTHPQYYGSLKGAPEHFLETPWYRQLVEAGDPSPEALWAGVDIDSAP